MSTEEKPTAYGQRAAAKLTLDLGISGRLAFNAIAHAIDEARADAVDKINTAWRSLTPAPTDERHALATVALARINQLSDALGALEKLADRLLTKWVDEWPPEIINARAALAEDEPAEIVAALEAAKR